MKAIILAGGRGSRLAPLTDNVPKALIPIGNATLIEHVINSLPEEIDTVVITLKHLGETIIKKIGGTYNGKTILYAHQPEQNGTWSALYSAKDYVENDELFLVLNCDDIFLKEELARVVQSKEIGMGVTTRIMPAKYHGVQINTAGYVTGLARHSNKNREEKVADVFANGLYILDSTVFSFPVVLQIDNEAGLPQTLLQQIEQYPLKAHTMNQWQPCNTFEDIEQATNKSLE